MSNAYLQLPLDAESKKFTTINTYKGIFEYTRLPFEVASAPAVFQRYMDILLQGIPQVSIYIDDILIWGTEQQQAFREARALLQADSLLAHYDPSKPLVVACDASQYTESVPHSHMFLMTRPSMTRPNDPSRTSLKHSLQLRSTTPNWKRRPLPLYLQ